MLIPFASEDGLVRYLLGQMLAAAAIVFFIVPTEQRITGSSARLSISAHTQSRSAVQ